MSFSGVWSWFASVESASKSAGATTPPSSDVLLQEQSPLLSLPAEIRGIIFGMALTPYITGELRPHEHSEEVYSAVASINYNHGRLEPNEHKEALFNHEIQAVRPAIKMAVALLRTCKLVQTETQYMIREKAVSEQRLEIYRWIGSEQGRVSSHYTFDRGLAGSYRLARNYSVFDDQPPTMFQDRLIVMSQTAVTNVGNLQRLSPYLYLEEQSRAKRVHDWQPVRPRAPAPSEVLGATPTTIRMDLIFVTQHKRLRHHLGWTTQFNPYEHWSSIKKLVLDLCFTKYCDSSEEQALRTDRMLRLLAPWSYSITLPKAMENVTELNVVIWRQVHGSTPLEGIPEPLHNVQRDGGTIFCRVASCDKTESSEVRSGYDTVKRNEQGVMIYQRNTLVWRALTTFNQSHCR